MELGNTVGSLRVHTRVHENLYYIIRETSLSNVRHMYMSLYINIISSNKIDFLLARLRPLDSRFYALYRNTSNIKFT